MYIALGSLLLIASGAAFWSVATYAQRHWPTQLQYVAAWIISSIVIAAVWALSSLAYDFVASPVHYCGFQDAAPCSRWDFLQEQLGIWTIVTFMTLVPGAATLGGFLFFIKAALKPEIALPRAQVEQDSARSRTIQMTLCALIATVTLVLPPYQFAMTLAKLVILALITTGGWLLAGRMIASGANVSAHNKAWLGYSFASTLVCSIVSAAYAAFEGIESCKGIVGDADCHARAVAEVPYLVAFDAVLYLIPVLALVRAVTLARVQFAERRLMSLACSAGVALFAAAIITATEGGLFKYSFDKPTINGWGPLRFGMTPEEAIKATPSVTWFDTSLEACRDRTATEGCQLDSIDNAGHLSAQGTSFSPTLKFNRKGELKEISLDAVSTIDRREECIALFDRMLDWLAKEHGPLKPEPEQSLPDLHEPWRHAQRKTAGGVVYDLSFNQTNQDFTTYGPDAQDGSGAYASVFGFIDSKGSSQCAVSVNLSGTHRYTDVDYD